MNIRLTATAVVLCCCSAQLRAELEQLKQQYETQIHTLEQRIEALEARAAVAQPAAAEPATNEVATQSSANGFNPAVSLILSGLYSSLAQDPADYRISGFPVPGSADIGPGSRGFSLTESELGIYASIDPYLYGGINVSIAPDDSVATEQTFLQTTSLPDGVTVKAGRFFSGIGYLDEQHAHSWDFVAAPLAYQAFLGSQCGDDALQLRWLAPTDTFLEFGAEAGRGRPYPGSDRDANGIGAATLFVHAAVSSSAMHSLRAVMRLGWHCPPCWICRPVRW